MVNDCVPLDARRTTRCCTYSAPSYCYLSAAFSNICTFGNKSGVANDTKQPACSAVSCLTLAVTITTGELPLQIFVASTEAYVCRCKCPFYSDSLSFGTENKETNWKLRKTNENGIKTKHTQKRDRYTAVKSTFQQQNIFLSSFMQRKCLPLQINRLKSFTLRFNLLPFFVRFLFFVFQGSSVRKLSLQSTSTSAIASMHFAATQPVSQLWVWFCGCSFFVYQGSTVKK